jgi:hypothetical protein
VKRLVTEVYFGVSRALIYTGMESHVSSCQRTDQPDGGDAVSQDSKIIHSDALNQ